MLIKFNLEFHFFNFFFIFVAVSPIHAVSVKLTLCVGKNYTDIALPAGRCQLGGNL